MASRRMTWRNSRVGGCVGRGDQKQIGTHVSHRCWP